MKIAPTVVTAVLLVAGVFHLLPAVGVLGAERLAGLYGFTLADPSLLLLMRHRALLFGLLGAFALHAAWSPPLQIWALAIALASTAGFAALAVQAQSLSPALRQVMRIDVGLAIALVVALVLRLTLTER